MLADEATLTHQLSRGLGAAPVSESRRPFDRKQDPLITSFMLHQQSHTFVWVAVMRRNCIKVWNLSGSEAKGQR